MAKIYARKIQAGEMTIDQVPDRWREATKALLQEAEQTKPNTEV